MGVELASLFGKLTKYCMKLLGLLFVISSLFSLPLGTFASPEEPELYDPVEYFNNGKTTYEMMDEAKELTALLEARMEHLMLIKIKDAKNRYEGLDEERFKVNLDKLLELIKSTQDAWEHYAKAVALEDYHGGGSGAGLRYSYAYCYKLIERINELKLVLK